jgi:hypothetical protein
VGIDANHNKLCEPDKHQKNVIVPNSRTEPSSAPLLYSWRGLWNSAFGRRRLPGRCPTAVFVCIVASVSAMNTTQPPYCFESDPGIFRSPANGVIAESVPKRTLSGIEERGARISQRPKPILERWGGPDGEQFCRFRLASNGIWPINRQSDHSWLAYDSSPTAVRDFRSQMARYRERCFWSREGYRFLRSCMANKDVNLVIHDEQTWFQMAATTLGHRYCHRERRPMVGLFFGKAGLFNVELRITGTDGALCKHRTSHYRAIGVFPACHGNYLG